MHTSPVDSISWSIALDTVRRKKCDTGGVGQVTSSWPLLPTITTCLFSLFTTRPCLCALVYNLIDFRNGRVHVYPHWRVGDRGKRAQEKINLVHTMSIDWTDNPRKLIEIQWDCWTYTEVVSSRFIFLSGGKERRISRLCRWFLLFFTCFLCSSDDRHVLRQSMPTPHALTLIYTITYASIRLE